MAAANTGNGVIEWDELPTDGSEAWFGVVLLSASSMVSLAAVRWLITTAAEFIMR